MRALPALVLAAWLAGSPAMAAPAGAWTVDKAASQARFASALNGEAFAGTFRRWDAAIRFDPANLAGSSVTASFEVASAVTGDADRDQALPGAPFFAAAKFPKAVFEAHAFKALGGGKYLALGTLTLRGVARPLTLPFDLAITGDKARMTGQVLLNRLAFGVGQNEWKEVQALPAAVKVTVSLSATRTR